MSREHDISDALAQDIRAAAAQGTARRIVGGNSKAWFGRTIDAPALSTAPHRGIISYEPTELVISARSGTPLHDIEELLAQHGQMLAFEPPYFGASATLGGTIACGLSGPRRPYAGAARDFVLGARIINGRGEVLRFGGKVMKNVAGYDIARLMCGAFGTLGLLLDVSLKVLPRPAATLSLVFPCSARDAIERMNTWSGQPLPLSAACHDGQVMTLRLEGAESAIRAAQTQLGGDVLADDAAFWRSVREHSHAFFSRAGELWRLSVPPATAPLELPGEWFIDWGGAQRWLISPARAEDIRSAVQAVGGHASRWRRPTGSSPVFHPLAPGVLAWHRQLKAAFDPRGILNPRKLYDEF